MSRPFFIFVVLALALLSQNIFANGLKADQAYTKGKLDKKYVHCTAKYKKVDRSKIDPELKKNKEFMRELLVKELKELYSCSDSNEYEQQSKAIMKTKGYKFAEIKLNDNWTFLASLTDKGYLEMKFLTYEQVFSQQKIPVPSYPKIVESGKEKILYFPFRVQTELEGVVVNCTITNIGCATSGQQKYRDGK